MSLKDDGELAFPVSNGMGDCTYGMTLRDYFIAHAPTEPQPWFDPVVQGARPSRCSDAAPEHLRAEVNAYATDDYSVDVGNEAKEWIKSQSKAVADYDREHEKQRFIQWPAAWADAMLEARK